MAPILFEAIEHVRESVCFEVLISMAKMVQNGPYDTRTLTKVFAGTSFALLLSTVWMVMADHSREWKVYQEAFREIEIQKRRADVDAAKLALDSHLVLTLRTEGSKANEVVKGHFIDKGDLWHDKDTGNTYAKSRVVNRQPMLAYLEEEVKKAKKGYEARAKEEAQWVALRDKAQGAKKALDLQFSNTKSKTEAAASDLSMAIHHNHGDIEGMRKKHAELDKKTEELFKERQTVESLEVHGYESTGPSGDEVKKMAPKKVVSGPLLSHDGANLQVEGQGFYKIADAAKAKIAAFVEVLQKNQYVQVILGSDGETVTDVVAPIRGLNGLKWKISLIKRDLTEAKKAVEGLQAELKRNQANLDKIDYSLVNDFFRNRPLADFVAPTLQVKQLVIEPLRDDYFFAQIRKVDRCETCHLGIDKVGFNGSLVAIKHRGMIAVDGVKRKEGGTDWQITHKNGEVETLPYDSVLSEPVAIKEPFTSHPRLDLFLTSMSPHPKETFGCTICHMGEGRSMDFHHAAHSPQNHEQEHEWHEKFHWHKRHHWDFPQRRKQYMEASCILCHDNNRPVEGAEKLNFGREVWERVSCFGCHKMKGYLEENKKGPDLRRLASKLNKEWTFQWLENPMNFRAKTNMPRFWFHSGEGIDEKASEEEKQHHAIQTKRDQAEIVAITEYLWAMSGRYDYDGAASQTRGSAERGMNLFNERGCVGCHTINKDAAPDDLRQYSPNEYGPNLARIGEKTNYEWLFSWLKNPKTYWDETRMPHLQLSDAEAHDLAAYMATLRVNKNPAKLPTPDKEVVETLIRDFLGKNASHERVEEMLSGKAGDAVKFPEMKRGLNLERDGDRLLYLGRQSLTRYGCYGCHLVTGMETRPGIGAELSNIGDKALDKIDWGHTHHDELPHWREDWIKYKVKNPRYTDKGKRDSVKYLDRARMPRFNMTDAEREALITWLSGHTEKPVPDNYKYKPSIRKHNQQEGAYMIHRKNCKACHMLNVDEITLRQRVVPEEVDEETKVNGKSIEAWVEVFEESEDMAQRIKAAEALTKAKAFVQMRELLEGMDEDEELLPLRKAMEDGINEIYAGAGSKLVKVKGVVLFDNQFERDPNSGAVKRDAKGHGMAWKWRDDDGQIVKVNGETFDARGAALVQLWAAGGGKNVGEFLAVSNNPASDPSLFSYSEIVSVKPLKTGVDSKIPESLRKAFPNDFLPVKDSAAYLARHRGGQTIPASAWQRAVKKLGDDPRVLTGNFDLGLIGKVQEAVVEGRSYGPPHLLNEGAKVQVRWLSSFLRNPSVKIRPWLNMRMPNYYLTDVEAQKIAKYFSSSQEDVVVAEGAKALTAIQNEVKAAKKDGKVWSRRDIEAQLASRVASLGALEYFETTVADGVLNFRVKGDVSLLQTVEEKTDGYQDEKESASQYWYSKGHELFLRAQCLSCHVWEGRKPGKDDPSSWGPDLSRVKNRIRPEWFVEWVANPQEKIPGTKMSQQIKDAGFPDVLKADAKTQIDCLKDWVFAGMRPAFEVFPKEVKSGEAVRVSSQMVSGDNIQALYVTAPDGSVQEYLPAGSAELKNAGDKAKPFTRELSEGRASALSLVIEGKAGDYWISTTKDPKSTKSDRKPGEGMIEFQARTKVTVK